MNNLNVKKPIVYFGRVSESKGIKFIIEAVYELYKDKFKGISPLWIVGGNFSEIHELRTQKEIKTIIRDLETENLLFWWGHIPHDFLPIILERCSVFCFASRYEPGGRTILEAMACALPVIATNQGFAPEIIKNGINGYIIDDNSVKSWVEKIKIILSDDKFALSLGTEAKRTITENYMMKHFFNRHWEIYEHFYPKMK